MNILHTETLKRWGGQQKRVLNECIGLSQKGHKIVLVCNKNSMLSQKAKEAGIKVYELDFKKSKIIIKIIINILKLIKIIKKEKIEIVATHSSTDSWAGGIAAKLSGCKLVRFRHNLYPIGKDPLTRFIYKIPDRFIVLTEFIKNEIEKINNKSDKIAIIPSGIDIEKFNPKKLKKNIREKFGIPNDALIIGNTSTFTQVKGQEYLLKAFNKIYKVYPCYLVFAGAIGEPYKQKYLAYVEESLRDRVLFLGHRDDIPEVLSLYDVFVYPSYLEGQGQALIEAMAMKKAVALSEIDTFKEFIIDGVNGVFFKPRDPDDIAEKVIYLLKDKEKRQRLGEEARKTVLEKFTLEQMIEKTEKLYKELLNAK
ncbi:glycosyltransferase family 4 protein [Thermodesulfovibrio hydrogeniphilus]